MIKTNKRLKIEIGPISSCMFSYNDAILHCFLLNIDGKIGWRMPTESEYMQTRAMGWHIDDPLRYTNDLYPVTPVRDLKDD